VQLRAENGIKAFRKNREKLAQSRRARRENPSFLIRAIREIRERVSWAGNREGNWKN
jgi:hypothetical protein